MKLGDFITVTGGGTPSKKVPEYWNGNIPWATVKDLKNYHLHETQDFISEEGLKNSATKIVQTGKLIIATRMAVGKVVIPQVDVAINQDLKGISCSKELNYQFLYYYFKTKEPYLNSIATGATVKGIKINHITELDIIIPPLSVQQRIATILDTADALKQKNKALTTKYDELCQSLFLDMFGDPSNNQKGFNKGTIRDLVIEAKYGTSSKAVDGGKYPYLRMGNITYQGYMDFNDLKYIDLSNKDKPKYLVKKGDLLFNRTNSKELVGKTGLYTEDIDMAIAGYLIRVRANQKANPYFIWGYLNSKHGKLILNNMCKNIIGMANINAQELQDIIILLPPLDLQNQFAERIQAIGEQKQQAQASLKKSEDLFNCLLQKAFKGELVT